MAFHSGLYSLPKYLAGIHIEKGSGIYKCINYIHVYIFTGIYIIRSYTGVAPVTQVTHVRNENSNIQGRSLYVINDFPYYKELLIKERNCSLWEQFFP